MSASLLFVTENSKEDRLDYRERPPILSRFPPFPFGRRVAPPSLFPDPAAPFPYPPSSIFFPLSWPRHSPISPLPPTLSQQQQPRSNCNDERRSIRNRVDEPSNRKARARMTFLNRERIDFSLTGISIDTARRVLLSRLDLDAPGTRLIHETSQRRKTFARKLRAKRLRAWHSADRPIDRRASK